MKQLSSTTRETRFPHNLPTTAGKAQYVLDHLQRFLNKFFGRPANRKTVILAEMLAQLRAFIESALPSITPVTHAIITSPDGMCLTDWEMNDVLDYLRIENLMEGPDSLYSISAAHAGTGHGLCKEYTKLYRCEAEDHLGFPYKNVLNVDFSDQALRMTIKGMRTYKAFGGGEAVVDTDLGYVEGLDDEEMEELFVGIGGKMRSFVQSQRRKITMILLTGTRVGEHRFKKTLRDALENLVATQAMEEIDRSFSKDVGVDVHTVFATAKGAAEVAKRRMEAPVRCLWREDCEALKAGKHEEGLGEVIEL